MSTTQPINGYEPVHNHGGINDSKDADAATASALAGDVPTTDIVNSHVGVNGTGRVNGTNGLSSLDEKNKIVDSTTGPSFVFDGGTTAWLQVLGSFMLFFNTWGNLNTFGIFQTYYEKQPLFKESSSNIAWIGAIQAYLLLFMSMLSGPIFDRGYLRFLIVSGAFLVVLGYMMLSLCHEFWQVILAQGFCIGFGGALLYLPAIALLPTYFKKRLGMALGLAAAGSSTGGVIYPIVFYRLIDRIGFGWTTRVLGFIALVTLLVPAFVMKMRVKPAKVRAIIDVTAFTDFQFVFFTISCLLGFIGLYVVFFYISFFGSYTGYTNDSLSFYLIPILNAASVFGRTVPNALSDKVGILNLLVPGTVVCSILIFSLLAVHNTAGIIIIAVFFGFFSGIFIGLPPVGLAVIIADKSKIGTRMGMAFALIGAAVLIGGPGAGAILGNGEVLHWNRVWIFGGVMTMGSAISFATLRMIKAGGKLMYKV